MGRRSRRYDCAPMFSPLEASLARQRRRNLELAQEIQFLAQEFKNLNGSGHGKLEVDTPRFQLARLHDLGRRFYPCQGLLDLREIVLRFGRKHDMVGICPQEGVPFFFRCQ
jgi:hypothetical protein